MKIRSLGDVANCASWVYSPVCVKHEGKVRAGQILRIIGTSTGKIYVQIQEDKIYAMSCKKVTMSGVSYAEKIAERACPTPQIALKTLL